MNSSNRVSLQMCRRGQRFLWVIPATRIVGRHTQTFPKRSSHTNGFGEPATGSPSQMSQLYRYALPCAYSGPPRDPEVSVSFAPLTQFRRPAPALALSLDAINFLDHRPRASNGN